MFQLGIELRQPVIATAAIAPPSKAVRRCFDML
jgi:hypothetical protein